MVECLPAVQSVHQQHLPIAQRNLQRLNRLPSAGQTNNWPDNVSTNDSESNQLTNGQLTFKDKVCTNPENCKPPISLKKLPIDPDVAPISAVRKLEEIKRA